MRETGQVTRIFLSAVSSEFRSYRLKLANQLGALKGRPFEIKVQEDFQQGGDTLLDALADYIRDCDLVVHIVGDACGARPTWEHERTLFRHLDESEPDPLPGWSYTQWEYRLARRFNKRVLVYLAEPQTPRDGGRPIRQSEADGRLQQAHVAFIKNSGEHRKSFASHHQLVREVFHDLGLELSLKVNNLPHKSLGSLFKGREAFLEQIRTTLGRAEHRGHQRFAAITASATAATIYGLGGIGKTRVAVEFALRHAEDYTALLFVGAASPTDLQQNLAGLCGPLVLDLAEKDAKETDVQVGAVVGWLSQHAGWFLIFDNVDTEAAARAVEDLLGRLQPAGQVLVTSRLSNWPGAVETLALDVLAESDASAFLLERTAGRRRARADDQAQARKLAVELGQLALALEQAGAYIATHRLTFAEYLAAWQTTRDKVLAWFDERVMQYPKSVAVTWQTSFDQLDEPARDLLNRLAWLDPEPMPEMLLDVPVTDVKAEHDPRAALAQLEGYSLVTRSTDAPTLTVHRLVADVTRRRLAHGPATAALRQTLRWIDAAFIGEAQDVRNWPILEPLAPHVRALVGHADRADIIEPTARLMNILGSLLSTKAQFAEAEPHFQRALAINEKSLGPEHPDVARDLNNLAQLLQNTNRLSEAEPMMRRALAIDEKCLGSEHSNVARDLNDLALLLKATNRFAEAEPLFRRALAINEKSFSPEHPNVARDLNNLAQLLQHTNRFAEAEPMMRRALAIDERSFGPEHPNVARDLNNLALLLQDTNRLSEAEPLFRRALAINETSFGPEHPDVATGLNNLAAMFKGTNRFAEAEPLFRRALAIYKKCFGPEHPHVATGLNNLAALLKDTNRLAEAEGLIRRALAIFETSYGSEDPNVGIRLNNLALLLQDTNRLPEAEPLFRRALVIYEKSFGPEHPHVATGLSNLALLLQATNRLFEAEPMMRRALAIDEKSFGSEHPNVARDLNNLALLLQDTNRLSEAEPLFRRALAINEKSFSPEHPNVARDLNNLAQLLRHTNRLSKAEPMMRRALAIDERSFGPEHPNVARDLNNLALLLQDTNRLSEAEPLFRRALAINETSFGPEHPDVATGLNNLATMFKGTNRLSEAEPLFRRALAIFEKSYGAEHPSTRAVRDALRLLDAKSAKRRLFRRWLGKG